MAQVRQGKADQEVLRYFCGFIHHDRVWNLATVAVPEFRFSIEEQ